MAGFEDVTMQELRAMRTSARRALELARMRAIPADPESATTIEHLRATVEQATEELIRRYSDDLGLVDSLLGAPYAQRTSRHEAGES